MRCNLNAGNAKIRLYIQVIGYMALISTEYHRRGIKFALKIFKGYLLTTQTFGRQRIIARIISNPRHVRSIHGSRRRIS